MRLPDTSIGDETDDRSSVWRSELFGKFLIALVIAGHVLFYDVLPAVLAWAVGSAQGLDLFSGFDAPSLRRVAALGFFLSAVAAIITTESVTLMGRPFGPGAFITTAVAIGVVLFPSVADWHRIRLGLAPDQFAILQSYCYLALRVMVGFLIGAIVSWVGLARYMSQLSAERPQHARK